MTRFPTVKAIKFKQIVSIMDTLAFAVVVVVVEGCFVFCEFYELMPVPAFMNV
jgi:hypothetical protein